MELTRRDALAALVASGVAVGTGAVLGTDVEEGALDAAPFDGAASSADDAGDSAGHTDDPADAEPLSEDRLATLLAVADVVYPSAVTGGGNASTEDSDGGTSETETSGAETPEAETAETETSEEGDGDAAVEAFVRTYALGRTADRPEYREGMAAALATLDEYARSWHDADFRDLDAATRESVLDQMAVDAASPDPGGADRERVRYYVVNELLYALYASPTGGRLVGIENPQGHPGGTDSYRRGPRE